MDYNTKVDKELNQVEKVARELAHTWKAHLYLSKMKLREDKMPQVLTGALGRYTVDALRKSASAAFPTLGTIRGASMPAQDHFGYSTCGKSILKGRMVIEHTMLDRNLRRNKKRLPATRCLENTRTVWRKGKDTKGFLRN